MVFRMVAMVSEVVADVLVCGFWCFRLLRKKIWFLVSATEILDVLTMIISRRNRDVSFSNSSNSSSVSSSSQWAIKTYLTSDLVDSEANGVHVLSLAAVAAAVFLHQSH